MENRIFAACHALSKKYNVSPGLVWHLSEFEFEDPYVFFTMQDYRNMLEKGTLSISWSGNPKPIIRAFAHQGFAVEFDGKPESFIKVSYKLDLEKEINKVLGDTDIWPTMVPCLDGFLFEPVCEPEELFDLEMEFRAAGLTVKQVGLFSLLVRP